MTVPFSAVRAIRRKRNGEEHPPGEIESLVAGFLDGSVPDYQMTAWMMAVLFRGMTREETSRLTRAMLASGDRLPPWGDGPPVVDKHSTGGVGDKVSLIVAPLVAACGLWVPMISGRALGHTGGTLDKLETISGYRVDLEPEVFRAIVKRVGCSIAGASRSLVPADRRMYALRDVAGIVESAPLIVSSILSKKAAARLDGLVLDVKVGIGGFSPVRRGARKLARMLVEAGSDLGLRTEALLTRMEQPLGRAVGNSLEVEEAVRVLRNEGDAQDLEEVCIEVASAMLRVGGEGDGAEGRQRLVDAWRSGLALERFAMMVEAHGGDPRLTDDLTRLPRAASTRMVEAKTEGWIGAIDAREVGEVVIDLGGGRRRVDDSIDPRVGVRLCARVGDRVAPGDPLAEVHLGRDEQAEAFIERLRQAFLVSARRPRRRAAVLERVTAEGTS